MAFRASGVLLLAAVSIHVSITRSFQYFQEQKLESSEIRVMIDKVSFSRDDNTVTVSYSIANESKGSIFLPGWRYVQDASRQPKFLPSTVRLFQLRSGEWLLWGPISHDVPADDSIQIEVGQTYRNSLTFNTHETEFDIRANKQADRSLVGTHRIQVLFFRTAADLQAVKSAREEIRRAILNHESPPDVPRPVEIMSVSFNIPDYQKQQKRSP